MRGMGSRRMPRALSSARQAAARTRREQGRPERGPADAGGRKGWCSNLGGTQASEQPRAADSLDGSAAEAETDGRLTRRDAVAHGVPAEYWRLPAGDVVPGRRIKGEGRQRGSHQPLHQLRGGGVGPHGRNLHDTLFTARSHPARQSSQIKPGFVLIRNPVARDIMVGGERKGRTRTKETWYGPSDKLRSIDVGFRDVSRAA